MSDLYLKVVARLDAKQSVARLLDSSLVSCEREVIYLEELTKNGEASDHEKAELEVLRNERSLLASLLCRLDSFESF